VPAFNVLAEPPPGKRLGRSPWQGATVYAPLAAGTVSVHERGHRGPNVHSRSERDRDFTEGLIRGNALDGCIVVEEAEALAK
jgi:hypothetical protein